MCFPVKLNLLSPIALRSNIIVLPSVTPHILISSFLFSIISLFITTSFWVYEIPKSKEKTNTKNTLAIDLGVNNLLTCVTNSGDAFIIDGKRMKSINQQANKENARLQRIKDLQGIEGITSKQASLWRNRNNRISDYISKAASCVINYCKGNDVSIVILGYNNDIQKGINIGKTNNQNFVNIPLAQIRDRLKYICERDNIKFIEQEESYTSKADFLSGDKIPVYKEAKNISYIFSGKRIKRGLYKSNTGVVINADINGALNIMKKANVCDISLVNNAYLSPIRINMYQYKTKKKAEAR